MDLYIFRHGIAHELSRSGHDRDRELTSEGEQKTRDAGKALRKLGVEFDLVLSSPFARAWQTAEILVKELKCEDLLRKCEALASGEPSAGVLAELKREARKSNSILLVGHEPDLSQLISILLSGSPRLSIVMKKGGLCKLTCDVPDAGAATLEWLLTPKLFERMA
jgi:phosphohistidine phosphatase